MNLLKAGAKWLRQYILNILISLDQLVNVLIGGKPDETISSRAGKGRLEGSIFWTYAADFIDLLFYPLEKNHCFNSIEWDE